ncbi:MAG: hypothetical protein NTV88_03040 [Candidatus Micrarchaeota archaeon]|nr:hypothetical protein [Candidatus Micrarchaeota archaeon]
MEEPQHELGTIRLAYVTSPREITTEGVGTDSRIIPTIEFLQRQIESGNLLTRKVVIAAVFVDDNGTAHGNHGNVDPSPTFEYLRNFCQEHGIAFHVEESKPWRQIPAKVEQDGVKVPNTAKHEAKVQYEQRMLSFMRENDIDVILSDSYTVLFNSVMLDERVGYNGLIINIHPGYAAEVPGVTPTRDAHGRANLFTHTGAERHEAFTKLFSGKDAIISRNGYDKSIAGVYGRMGAEFEFVGDSVRIAAGQRNIARAVTGATLHVVDALIDHGPTILTSTGTPIRRGDDVESLRIRNYQTKNNVVVRGLAKYLVQTETQDLITENRIRNRAHNSDSMSSLPNYGSTNAFGRVPVKERVPVQQVQPVAQIIGGSNGKRQ